jgi:hypothetical protein
VRSATEKATDNVVTYELIEQEITNANRIETGFVDLGLPSGTLWKAINEPGLYTYQEANDKFVSEEEHLPTYEQLFELKQECQWGRTDTGYELLGPNGNSITFSAEGYVDCGGTHHYANGGAGMFGTETIGMIWSSTPTDADKAYSMGIGTYNAGTIQSDNRCYGRSVHLVKSAEKEIEKENVADNIITYTSLNGNIINLLANSFDATIVSNTYKNGKGTIVFDGPVTSIGNWTFRYCELLTSVTIPNSVTRIEDHAFYDCKSLTSITIPNSVKSIGYWAFYGCTSLTSVTIPNSVTEIGGWAFHGCTSLTSVTIPNSVTEIIDEAFRGCKSLTSIIIPNSVTSIGKGAFWGCSSLTSVTIPNSVTRIGNQAFEYCTSLTSVTIPNSVTKIELGAFYGCKSLTSVTIPNSVTRIGQAAFWGCSSLTSVTIPNSVTRIEDHAFYDCKSLTSVTILNSKTSIGWDAFPSYTEIIRK